MSRPVLFLCVGAAVLLALGGAALGLGWWLFGANERAAAEFVPANTLAFATIPNAVTLLQAYQSSQAKSLLEAPNLKPLQDFITTGVGAKNVNLLFDFLPNLSGQSFVAVTHFDPDHPEKIGLIAGMRPKAGLGDFGSFLKKLKEAYPELWQQGRTGTSMVAGQEYEWIQGPGATDKICVAHVHGWIVTTWGEAALQDWLERYRKTSTTSSLAEDNDYRKSLERVGENPMTLVYVNYRDLMGIACQQLAKTNPPLSEYLGQKRDVLGGAAVATRFENGEMVDRYSFLLPRPDQIKAGMGNDPCPFETLKFTSRNTRLYWAASVNWEQYYEALVQANHRPDAVASAITDPNPWLTALQNWAHDAKLDLKHNLLEALGPEVSLQGEWNEDSALPEIGLFVKVDKPDDFRPVIQAIVETVRKTYANSAVINQINQGDQNFTTLNFVPSGSITPTITQDGPYFGIFLSANQAVRSFQRDAAQTLAHNDHFQAQIGSRRDHAAQIAFLDSPYLLDRSYKTAMPYISMLGMFSKDLATAVQSHPLPNDLTWLAPIGTWSCVVTTDEAGIQAYSVSGVGNQGLLWSGALGGAAGAAQSFGFFAPKPVTPPLPPAAPVVGASGTSGVVPSSLPSEPSPVPPDSSPTPHAPPPAPPTNP